MIGKVVYIHGQHTKKLYKLPHFDTKTKQVLRFAFSHHFDIDMRRNFEVYDSQ